MECPNFDLPFYVQCDSSGLRIGAVLSQRHEDGTEHVICYLSRSLTKAEQKCITTKRELLAILWALEKLRCYLKDSKLFVITEHYSLKWLDNIKNPNGRLCRWALKMQQYDFTVIHCKERDTLSIEQSLN